MKTPDFPRGGLTSLILLAFKSNISLLVTAAFIASGEGVRSCEAARIFSEVVGAIFEAIVFGGEIGADELLYTLFLSARTKIGKMILEPVQPCILAPGRSEI